MPIPRPVYVHSVFMFVKFIYLKRSLNCGCLVVVFYFCFVFNACNGSRHTSSPHNQVETQEKASYNWKVLKVPHVKFRLLPHISRACNRLFNRERDNNPISHNRPQDEALGNKPHKLCSCSQDPRTEVYCFRLNFNISKSVYSYYLIFRDPNIGYNFLFLILALFTQQIKSLSAVVRNLEQTYFATYGYSFPLTGKTIWKIKTGIIRF